MPYTHFGKQADVFKHVILCEVLKREKPDLYVETNSACAEYMLSNSLEQQYGICHFLNNVSESGKKGIPGSFVFRFSRIGHEYSEFSFG